MGSDFVEEGRRAGRWLVEKTKGTTGDVNIVELQGTVGSAPAIDRKKGFEEIIKANPRFKIIRSQTGDFTRAKGKEVMEAFLKAEGKKINVLYAHNDDMAIGAIQAIEEAGLKPAKDIIIISIDGVKGAFEAMIAGKLNVSVECSPLLGPQLMQAVKDLKAGKTLPRAHRHAGRRVPDGSGGQGIPEPEILTLDRGAGSGGARADAPLHGRARALGRRLSPASRGEVHALMGQNGAGKSTLIKVLTGVYPADGGELRLDGEIVRPASPAAAQRLGISTVYQEVNLCPNLSVAENIFAGRYPRRGAAGLRRIDWPRMHADARALLARLHLDIDVTRLLSSYSVAVQQMVAIARALSVEARVLILDEPTSSLDEDEVERLFAVLRRLRDEGLAILFVTHFLGQMYAISDRITVLRNGELVGEYLKAELPPPALITAMVGRELSVAAGRDGARRRQRRRASEPLLRGARRSAGAAICEPVDLELRRGEIVGVGGLLGSGRTELARLLFGLDKRDSGELRVDGAPVRFASPAQAIGHGLAMCPEERKLDGIVAELSRAREHRPRAAGAPGHLPLPLAGAAAGDRRRASSPRSASAPPTSTRRSRCSPAATSRRRCSRAGSRPSRSC